MKTKQIWANLGVENIERTKTFYQSLGFQLNGSPSDDLVSFFFGPDKFVIHFFKTEKLESSLEGKTADLNKGNEVMFSMAAESKEEYNNWVTEIDKAGGKIVFDSNKDRKAFYDDNGFYVCVFTDPDGHKFNLLSNENM
ncbi:VOC family protein [uncultured Marixanthomonas sp.]|uniref:VOC family protein n=1 Tax=uncultured Marixanthomonas sp. TaxID=757245 RepID=UPI0030DB0453|tara:strand:+ start:10789 stop:11205 length:417 start_codon:yes stop_codon:yes gene_type:complete